MNRGGKRLISTLFVVFFCLFFLKGIVLAEDQFDIAANNAVSAMEKAKAAYAYVGQAVQVGNKSEAEKGASQALAAANEAKVFAAQAAGNPTAKAKAENAANQAVDYANKAQDFASKLGKTLENEKEDAEKKGQETELYQVPDVGILNKTGTGDPQTLIGKFIRVSMGILGSIALAMMVYGGFLYLTSMGNSERQRKGVTTVLWSSLGLTIIFSSYIIVKFLFQVF